MFEKRLQAARLKTGRDGVVQLAATFDKGNARLNTKLLGGHEALNLHFFR